LQREREREREREAGVYKIIFVVTRTRVARVRKDKSFFSKNKNKSSYLYGYTEGENAIFPAVFLFGFPERNPKDLPCCFRSTENRRPVRRETLSGYKMTKLTFNLY
jgi:hypothetical protein